MQNPKLKKLKYLNEIMARLSAADLTLAEAKVLNERLRSVLESPPESDSSGAIRDSSSCASRGPTMAVRYGRERRALAACDSWDGSSSL